MNPGRIGKPKHLRFIASEFVETAFKPNGRTILTIPPRHGKSETCSHYGPSWYLINRPRNRVQLVSYQSEFAASWGRKSRDVMAEIGPLFGLHIRDDVAARDAWEITQYNRSMNRRLPTGGSMVTAGIGGPLTGKGGDLVIIDDPVKNSEEAFSITIRNKTWDWYASTLYSRLEPEASIILIQTRWHEDDLAGRLITEAEAGGEQWNVINIPAIAVENDPMGREPGEALWPERYSIEDLRRIEKTMGSYWFSALYQQSPIPVGKGLFQREWERRFSETESHYILQQPDGSTVAVPKSMCQKFCTVDLAVSMKTSADFTVVSTFAMTPNQDLLVLNMRKLRLEGPDQVPLIQQVWVTDRPAVIYVEKVGYQLSLIQSAVRAGLPVLPIEPDGDKIARALTASARQEAGKLYFPVYADFLNGEEGLLTELYRFPAAKHDDMVDTISYAAYVQAGIGFVGTYG